jgi:hypothetical protein
MNSSTTRQSTLVFLGLPASVGIGALLLALAIAVIPYLSGQELGGVTLPELSSGTQTLLLWLGPVLLLISGLALFVPAWRVLKPGTPSDDDVRRWATEHGFANPYDLGIRNYEQCLRDLGYQPMRKLKAASASPSASLS